MPAAPLKVPPVPMPTPPAALEFPVDSEVLVAASICTVPPAFQIPDAADPASPPLVDALPEIAPPPPPPAAEMLPLTVLAVMVRVPVL